MLDTSVNKTVTPAQDNSHILKVSIQQLRLMDEFVQIVL